MTSYDEINDRLKFEVDRVVKGPVGREEWIWLLTNPFLGSYDLPALGIPRACGNGPLWSIEKFRALVKIKRGDRPR